MQAQPYDAEKHNKDPDGNNQEWTHNTVWSLVSIRKMCVTLMHKDNEDKLAAMRKLQLRTNPLIKGFVKILEIDFALRQYICSVSIQSSIHVQI